MAEPSGGDIKLTTPQTEWWHARTKESDMDLPDAVLENMQTKKVQELAPEGTPPGGEGQGKGQSPIGEAPPSVPSNPKEHTLEKEHASTKGSENGTGKRPLSQSSRREEDCASSRGEGKGPRIEGRPREDEGRMAVAPMGAEETHISDAAASESGKGGGKGPVTNGEAQKGGGEIRNAALALVSRWDKGGSHKRDYVGEQASASKDGNTKTGFCECGCSKTCQEKPGRLVECLVCGNDIGSRCCWDFERNTCHNCSAKPEKRRREKQAATLEGNAKKAAEASNSAKNSTTESEGRAFVRNSADEGVIMETEGSPLA